MMNKHFQKIRLATLACFLASLLTACLDSSDSGSTSSNNENDTNDGSNSPATEYYVITADNMDTLSQRIVRLMSQNQASRWATRSELNPIYLATLLRDHLDHLNSGKSNEELTADLCPQGGSVSLEVNSNNHLFTYNQCSSRNEFDSSNPFVRDGTIKLTEVTDSWLIELDLKFQTTQHKATLEFAYSNDSNYQLTDINLTRTPDSEFSNIVFFEDLDIIYNASLDDITISGIYGETARTELPNLESGKVEIISDNLNRLDVPTRGTVALRGANNTQATIDFSSGNPVITLDD